MSTILMLNDLKTSLYPHKNPLVAGFRWLLGLFMVLVYFARFTVLFELKTVLELLLVLVGVVPNL